VRRNGGVSLLLTVLVGVSLLTSPIAGAASTSPGTFSPPSTVPNLVSLGATSFSDVQAVSCTSNGDCVDVGTYGGQRSQGFIDVETNSVWGPAMNVPGAASLGATGMVFNTLSCSSTGNCAAGGLYNTTQFSGGSYLAFVVDEVNGVWQSAEMVPGTGSVAPGSTAQVVTISCPSNGNCSLGGFVSDANDNDVAFVADEVSGTWQKAKLLTGVDLSAYNVPQATISSISCTSAGNCVAGGYGWNGLDRYQDQVGGSGFIVTEASGAWGAPVALSGIVTTSGSNLSQVNTVSCSTSTECVIGGTYFDGHEYQAFLASDLDGSLGSAIEVPGTATLNAYSKAQVVAASCTASGACTIAGTYEGTAGNGLTQSFVDSEVAGTWGTAIQIPEQSSDLQSETQLTSLSCGSPGNCVVGGWIGNSGLEAPYVDQQSGGEWSVLQRVASEDAQNAQASSLSGAGCAPNEGCELGGYIQGMFGWYAITVRYDLAPSPPSQAPSKVVAVPGNASAAVSWTAPSSNGGSPITSYTAIASPGGKTCTWTTGPLRCTVSGLVNGDPYTFTVTATNVAGTGPASMPSSAVTPATAPGAPIDVKAIPGDGSATLSWSAPSDGGSTITGYTVTAAPGGKACTAASTKCEITGLNPMTEYTLSVVAANTVGRSSASTTTGVYPFSPNGFGIEMASSILSRNVRISVVVAGATPGTSVRVSMPHAAGASCTADVLGQCRTTLVETSNGIFALHAISGQSKTSTSVYVPLVRTPATVKHGSRTAISVWLCPKGALVSLSLSDGRTFRGTASKQGSISFRVEMPKRGKVALRTMVSGTPLAPLSTIDVT
jgi:hypothetical protein